MKMVRCLTHAAVVLACCGLLLPQAALSAGPGDRGVHDIALTPSGSLAGMLVNPNGQPLDGAVVSVRRGETEVARAVSNKQGAFEVAGMKSGVYDIAVGQQVASVRAWSSNIAPPGAREQAVIVVGDASRGQFASGLDFITLVTVASAVGAVTLSAITLAKVNDVEDKVDEIRDLVSP